MSLTSLIVQREIATIREVEEALARQVLYGGDLLTNLLEVSRVDESAVLPVVAESFGLPAAPPGELPIPSPDAKSMVAAEVAAERNVAPLSVDRYGLVLAVAEPLAKDVEQELAFALALPIAQKIAPLVRIKEALAREYGVAIERRMARLLARLRGDPSAMGSIPPPNVTLEMKAPPRPPTNPPEPLAPRAPEPTRRGVGMPRSLVRTTDVPPPRPPKRRRGPLTADVARVELEEVGERDTIFDLVFEFARQFFDYTALFVVHGDVAEGRDAYGDGAPREKVVRVGVPLDLPGMLSDARIRKGPVRQVPSREGIDPVLLDDLARRGGTECVVLPIVVRTRVVALVFGDGGDGGIDETSLAEVRGVVAAAVAAFERIIVRRKLKGTAPPLATGVGSAPPKSITKPPPTEMSNRPAAEELAPPIRDLMTEPVSRVAVETKREPQTLIVEKPRSSDRPLSERPPPANLLGVRRPSGPPIPREEPESSGVGSAPPPRSRPPVHVRSKTGSGALRRAEAPPLEFGAKPPQSPMAFGQDDIERGLLAQIHGTTGGAFGELTQHDSVPATTASPVGAASSFEAPPSTNPDPPPSPKAVSPPPPMTRGPSRTEVSPGALPMFPARTDDTSAPAAPVGMEGLINEDDKTPIAPPPAFDPPIPPPRQPYLETKSAPVLYVPPAEVVDVDESGVEVTQLPSSSAMQAAPPISPHANAPDTTRTMPISEQQVSVSAHRPPSARTDATRVLPSVIVDVASEYVAFVDRVLAGPDDEAEEELLRAGGYAMPAIMARFPGPITVENERLDAGVLPRISECGPVLRLVASQRRTALPFVLAHAEDEDDTRRFWATYLLTELVYPDAIQPVIDRAFDPNPRVRRAARAAARAVAEMHAAPIVERLAGIAHDATLIRPRRALAIEALAETRDPLAVPPLIPLLGDPANEIAVAARQALVTIARQDFALDADKWRAWWSEHGEKSRIEWLIDALMHEQALVRAAAGEELKTLTKEHFGYYEDLPRRERAAAQNRYREWWSTVGRLRFSHTQRG